MKKQKKTLLNEKGAEFIQVLVDMRQFGGSYGFLGDYPDLPNAYEGSDIDMVVESLPLAKRAFRQNQWVIQQNSKGQFRAFAHAISSAHWVIIDVWRLKSLSSPLIGEYIIKESVPSSKTGLLIPPVSGLLAWKTAKYLKDGAVREERQLADIAKQWEKAPLNTRNDAIRLLEGCGLECAYFSLIDAAINGDSSIFIKSAWAKNDLALKKRNRHKRRVVYGGDIVFGNLFKSFFVLSRLVKALFIKSDTTLPAIAVVGNDGSGKTTLCFALKKGPLVKTDPVHIVMRRTEPWLPVYKQIRPRLSAHVKKHGASAKSTGHKLASWIIEAGDFVDRYMRFKLGKGWADAGLGLVLLERYPTDRLRGEYPGPAGSLLPLEQFFPMPDVIVLLDVSPEGSLRRKPDDGHYMQEQQEKKDNYLRLIYDIKPSEVLNADSPLENAWKRFNRIIWDYCCIKQNKSQASTTQFPARWTPRLRR